LEENFTGSTAPLALAKIFLTGMLTRDVFAVANFLVQQRVAEIIQNARKVYSVNP